MTVIQFVPATREAVYARLCLVGPGGSGKTYGGLMALHTLCDGQLFAVVDTERGRSKKYVGVNGWQFDIVEPHTFSPETLTETLGVAAGAGYPGILIDSGSQYWSGVEGMIEQVDKRAASASRSDKFSSGWKDMKPVERRMWDAILSYPGHVVMTLRTKVEYVVEDVERNGRTVKAPRKVGLKPVQRDEFEYEFDLVGELNQSNTLTVTKSDIITVPQGTVVDKPAPEFFEIIGEFCAEGVEAPGVMTYRIQALAPDATRDDLLELLTTVTRAGLKNAPVTDEDGNPTVLGDLITARGRALRMAAEQTMRAKQPVKPVQTAAAKQPAARAARPQAKTEIEKQAGTLVDALLTASTEAAVDELMDKVGESSARAVDATRLLSREARIELNIRPEDEKIDLPAFAALVCNYVVENGYSVNEGVRLAAEQTSERPAATKQPPGERQPAA